MFKKIAVVGATGVVGQKLCIELTKGSWLRSDLQLFASERSVGKECIYNDTVYRCNELKPGCFEGIDLVFFTAGSDVSRKYVPPALAAGCVVIDNTSCFRMHSEAALWVVGINDEAVRAQDTRLYSVPNCSTIQLIYGLQPIRLQWGIQRVVVSTYQSHSGAGRNQLLNFESQCEALLKGRGGGPLALDCLPTIGSVDEDGFNEEERKLMCEPQKIWGDDAIDVQATAVRVPVQVGHGQSVWVETCQPCEIQDVRDAWNRSPNVSVVSGSVCTQRSVVSSREVHVSRLRRAKNKTNQLIYWSVSDNLVVGAADQALRIAAKLQSDVVECE